MPFGGMLTIGLGGLIIGGVGSYLKGNAEQDIAQQQLQEARNTRAQALGYATPTLAEIQGFQSMLQNQQRTVALQSSSLDRDRSLLSSIDPAMVKAGQEAFDMMNGKEASTLSPLRNERSLQRQQLVDQLHQQFGSGYATSSAGIEALTRFDQETTNMMAGAQQNSLQMMLGTSLNARPDFSGDVNRSASTLGQLQGEQMGVLSNVQGRQISAINGTPITPYAGANSIGALSAGSSLSNFGNSLTNAATTMGTAQMYKGMFSGGGGGGGGGMPYTGGAIPGYSGNPFQGSYNLGQFGGMNG